MDTKVLSHYKGKKILVTGGTGYLGSSVVNALSQVACFVTVVGTKKQALVKAMGRKAKINLKGLDIRDERFWEKVLKGIDIVFHFAGQTSTYVANQNPAEDVRLNFLPAVRFVATCYTKNWRPDIIFSGTTTQVGLTKIWPVDESFIDKPVTVYDINKLAAEKYFQYYSQVLGGRAVTLRLANLYGPGPKSTSTDRGILNKMVGRAIKGESLTLYGRGNYLRDYVFIDDVVDAFLLAGKNIVKLRGNYYVIGSGQGHTLKEMFEEVKEQVQRRLGNKVQIKKVKAPADLSPIEFRNFVARTKAFAGQTGWKAKVNLQEGINRTIKYFLEENIS